MAMHGQNIYTVDEYVQPEVIDFLSDVDIYVNSLFQMVSSPPNESELGDIILSMVEVPLMIEEGSRDEQTEMEW